MAGGAALRSLRLRLPLRAGDQIRGLSQREARAVLQRIAAVHATYWMDPQLEAHPWLPSHTFWFQGEFDDLL